jgi:hypothetical protein
MSLMKNGLGKPSDHSAGHPLVKEKVEEGSLGGES